MPTCTTSRSSSSMSRTPSSIRWASRAWAKSASSASPRPSPMRSTTPPEDACATCRSRSINCSDVEMRQVTELVLLPLPHHDHPHRLVVDVRVRHRRALDVEPGAPKTDICHLPPPHPRLLSPPLR